MSGFVRSSLVWIACLTSACGASHPGGGGSSVDPASGDDGGTTTPAGPTFATEKGVILDFSSKRPVAGATVTAADQTATTASDGSYSITLKKGQPFTMTVAADGYVKTIEQEATLDADYDKGITSLVPNLIANLMTGMLDGADSTLGLLSVVVVPKGACASEQGATLKVSPAGSAKVAYFASKLPSSSAKSVTAGQFPSAIVYNTQPNVPLTLTVENTTCSVAPFPYQDGAIEYTGGITTEAGGPTAFARVFLQ